MDRGNLGHIVHRGDCVGKEKAVVKDIGPGFVTFVISSDDEKTPNGATDRALGPAAPDGSPDDPGRPGRRGGAPQSAPVVAPSSPKAGKAPPPTAPRTAMAHRSSTP